ncbi:MAG: hypothetical protein K6G30_05870 [Acetatifactor sp.]|nr:hypothetical protein [Acetatifactor sp.]
MQINRYFFSDLYRLWFSKRLFGGVLLIYTALILNSFLWGKSNDVLLLFMGIRTFSTIVITYIGASFCFSTSLAEDQEHGYVWQALCRGGSMRYCISKIVVCFGSAVFSYVAGYLLFVITYAFKYPLCDADGNIAQFYVGNDLFGSFIQTGHYLLFFIASSMLTGMLVGILAVCAMYLSLFIKSKVMVLSVPMLLHYFIDNYIENWLKLPDFLSPVYVFNSEVGAFNDRVLSLVFAVLYALLSLSLLLALTFKEIERRR